MEELIKILSEKFKGRTVAIGYPSPELIHTEFSTKLFEMARQHMMFVPIGLANAISSRISVNRNLIVERAREMKATDLLWIDTDTVFPENALVRLMNHDKDIVCATTCRRKPNAMGNAPVAVPMDPGSISPGQVLVDMKLVGFPFMLTKMSVFDKLDEVHGKNAQPYFAEPARWMTDIDTSIGSVVAEDEYFCAQVRKAGFNIWCDMNLSMEIGHIGSMTHYIQQPQQPLPAKIDMVLTNDNITEQQLHREADGHGE